MKHALRFDILLIIIVNQTKCNSLVEKMSIRVQLHALAKYSQSKIKTVDSKRELQSFVI